jgi:hypothetical protein
LPGIRVLDKLCQFLSSLGSGLKKALHRSEIERAASILQPCSHSELDSSLSHAVRCQGAAVVRCVACGKGACRHPFHIHCAFLTVQPSCDPFSSGTRYVYLCDGCRGPVCVRCLGIEDDYPCPADQVPAYPFKCPKCGAILRVATITAADMERAGFEFLQLAGESGFGQL